MSKYIILTGGPTSGIGKEFVAVALAALLQKHGYKTRYRSISPYMNYDTTSIEVGENEEVFVTRDGASVGHEVGQYERFTGETAVGADWTTLGRINHLVHERIKSGGYAGQIVCPTPHLTDAVNEFITRQPTDKATDDFVIVDLPDGDGGLCLKAASRLRHKHGKENVLLIHMALVPQLRPYGGDKLHKPDLAALSVGALNAAGVQPDLLVCRLTGDEPELQQSVIDSIASLCKMDKGTIFTIPELQVNQEHILSLHALKLDAKILSFFKMDSKSKVNLQDWQDYIGKVKYLTKTVNIGVLGKYGSSRFAYQSVVEAILHAGAAAGAHINIITIDARKLEAGEEAENDKLNMVDGFVFPGGYDLPGTEGIIKAVNFARTRKIPALGVCLGYQMMAVEFARNVLGHADANSTELNPDTSCPIVARISPTMHIGEDTVHITPGSALADIYQASSVRETYIHSWGIGLQYEDDLKMNGMLISASSDLRGTKVAAGLEVKNHPWFVGIQYHPEFHSHPFKANPIYRHFVEHVFARTQESGYSRDDEFTCEGCS